MAAAVRQPSLYLPHGGGPCFFMDDPSGVWSGMRAFLEGVPAGLPEPPRAILVISGHWETEGFLLTGAAQPDLVYDYYNFPPHTYALRYDVPGDPALAARAAGLLTSAGIEAGVDPGRGLDHGVFIPLKVALPDAAIPVVEMSLDQGLDPALHLAAGEALAPLRDEGVLILATGMSFHNMRGYGDPRFAPVSDVFDDWLTAAVASDPAQRHQALAGWAQAPSARLCHPPRAEEHLLPLMVVAGAAGQSAGRKVFSDRGMQT
ncbi:MAG: DODA-type extradiol aromatic ring-opening family dioxygenase, partial [Phenylobacterium sp.]